MAVFLVRAILGSDTFKYSSTPYFTDVPANHPFFQWVQKLKEMGITSGCSATAFCPDSNVTRAQTAVFIVRAIYGTGVDFAYSHTPYFTDVPDDIYFPAIQKMRQLGITNGCTSTQYCPNDSLTRGQMAVFIVRALLNQLQPVGTPALVSATPATGAAGTIVNITINGVNTHFAGGATTLSAGKYIQVTNVMTTSPSSLNATLALPVNTPVGPYSLVITTGAEEVILPNGFLVTAGN
jgi:hypothetical protein